MARGDPLTEWSGDSDVLATALALPDHMTGENELTPWRGANVRSGFVHLDGHGAIFVVDDFQRDVVRHGSARQHATENAVQEQSHNDGNEIPVVELVDSGAYSGHDGWPFGLDVVVSE